MVLIQLISCLLISKTYEFPSRESLSERLNFRIKHQNTDIHLTSLSSLSLLKPVQDVSKKDQELLCSRLKEEHQKEQDLSIESLYHLHQSSFYLNCQGITVKEETVKLVTKKVTSARSAYFLSELIEIFKTSKSGLRLDTQEIQAKANQFCTPKNEILELLYCALSKNIVENIDQIVSKIHELSVSSLNEASAVLYIQLVSNLTQTENIKKNTLKALDTIETKTSVDGVNMFHLCKLHSIPSNKGIHAIKVHSRYVESSGLITINVVDYITGQTVSYEVDIAVTNARCDNKDASSSVHVVSKQGNHEITVKQQFQECVFNLKISSQKPKILNEVHVVKVVKPLKLKFVDISVTHNVVEDTSTPTTETLSDISEVGSHIKDRLGRLILEFVLTRQNERIQPHQVFLRFSHQSSSFTTRYIAQANSNKKFSFVVNIEADGNNTFRYTSGKYSMDIVVGDFDGTITVTNIGVVSVEFSAPSNLPQAHFDRPPQHELHNTPQILYRKPYKIFPLIFTSVIGASAFILFLLWTNTNFSVGVKFSFWRLIFYTSLIGLTVVYFLYFYGLNGFQAFHLMAVCGGITLLSLSYVLDANNEI